ncbi:MAG TPA: glycosyl hydrolase family 65 protein [Solirubrobacteraceae bacterium]
MRYVRLTYVAVTVAAVMALAASTASAQGSYVLTAHSHATAARYAPTFTGNGFLGVRVPAAGQGYAGGTVPAQSELAGFYAKPSAPKTISDSVQQRANIPTWSTLLFGDGTQVFSTTQGTTSGWRQSIDLHTGIVTTSATWTASDGHAAKLTYQLLTDRADEHVGLVQLTVTPEWTGDATVTDEIDGAPATLTDETASGFSAAQHQDFVAVTTQGTGIEAAIASQLATSPNITATPTEVDDVDQSIGQQITFPVSSGQSYTITKYVGIDDSQDVADPVTAAQAEAATAAAGGYGAAVAANNGAWAAMWRGRIDVHGDRTLATDVNASEFYLWSSTRAGVDWSVSPAGLSSNGYDGHIFWDAETWMYPTLLAQHPDLAAAMEAYRFDRLTEAQQHAAATGGQGARFPWESALDGTEQIPPPISVNSEGLFEQHITADIALAQWQYYLVTGDRNWLSTRGWPVISGAAAFWAGRATRAAGGGYEINAVTGPDEENPNVNEEAFTEVGAKTTLQDAIAAARVLGQPVPSNWPAIAAGLKVPTATLGGQLVHPEFSGYRRQLVKQADVTLLQYPWLYPMPAAVAQSDINFYVPRTDPGGPSMSDAVNEIDTSHLGTPGCSSFVYTERSYQPFIRDVFDQFSETRTGGAFTFMTGIGGFLQEFLYGYSGMRWDANAVHFAPSLTSQLAGVVLHDLSWRGRTFDVSIGARTTTITLTSGPPLPVSTPAGGRTVSTGHPLHIATARPDLKTTTDAVRCGRVTASSAQPGAPALAAVDGSDATDWEPVSLPATLTAPTSPRERTVDRATVVWGRQYPSAGPKPNVPPKPGPVRTLRASRYELQVSANGHTWRTVRTVNGGGQRTTDVLRFPRVRARLARIRILAAKGLPAVPVPTGTPKVTPMPQLEELTVS